MNPAPPLRAIFIGDDAPLCQEISNFLEKEKITTTGPSSWEAGLRAIKSHPPDLVVLDLSGDRHGLQFLREIRNDPALANVPVVTLAPADNDDDVIRSFEAGAADCLSKPLNGGEFSSRVTAVIKAKLKRAGQIERELEAAQIAAESASRSRMELVDSVSHDVLALLEQQRGLLAGFDQTSLNASQQSALAGLKKGWESLSMRLGHLFDFAKAECGTLALKLETFPLLSWLNEILASLEQQAVQKKVKFTREMGEGLSRNVTSDRARIEEILRNLVGTLLELGKSSEIDLEISLQERPTALHPWTSGAVNWARKGELGLVLRETGPESTRQEFGPLFYSVFQLRPGLMTELADAGLQVGLAKRLVELMGGHIWVDNSHEGRMAIHVKVPLDLAASRREHTDMASKQVHKADTTFSTRFPMRILLVEDNPVNQDLTAKMLEKMGYKAKVAANGLEAMEALKQNLYDIVFMDLQMPGLDGYETTRRIHERWPGDHRPTILALSAHSIDDERKKCIEAGIDDFVAKPLEMDTLRVVLEHWSEVRGGKRTATSRLGTNHGHPTPPAPETAPQRVPHLVDLDRLLHFTGGNVKSVRDLLDFYFRQTGQQMDLLQAALEKGAAADVRRSAHTLVGSSATCGMETVAALLKEIERVSALGQLGQVADLCGRVKEELDRVKEHIRQRLAEMPEKKKDAVS